MNLSLIILAVIAGAAIAFIITQQLRQLREKRILGNEFNAAMVLGKYARRLKNHLEESRKQGYAKIDFQKLSVPNSPGYKLSLELSGYVFKVHGIPRVHKKTGRLSFYIDNSLTVKAGDRGGQYASESDNEFAIAAR
ncbi:MAG: hypothetical protein HY231_25610 [Acidobacteria bacterium]|nr:hypothetical protein [Acidobacteriota bacterium]